MQNSVFKWIFIASVLVLLSSCFEALPSSYEDDSLAKNTLSGFPPPPTKPILEQKLIRLSSVWGKGYWSGNGYLVKFLGNGLAGFYVCDGTAKVKPAFSAPDEHYSIPTKSTVTLTSQGKTIATFTLSPASNDLIDTSGKNNFTYQSDLAIACP